MLFETPRLLIRPFTERDVEALYPILSDPEVMRYIEPPFSMAQTAAFIRQAGLAKPPLVYAVRSRESGTLLGHLIFHPCGSPAEYEIGWILGREHWHKGYADELTAAVIAYAKEQGIASLLLECDPRQSASRHIAEKYGFSDQGTEDGCVVYRLTL
jgi:RimJ/RimL family protein N-acetyltransferase